MVLIDMVSHNGNHLYYFFLFICLVSILWCCAQVEDMTGTATQDQDLAHLEAGSRQLEVAETPGKDVTDMGYDKENWSWLKYFLKVYLTFY